MLQTVDYAEAFTANSVDVVWVSASAQRRHGRGDGGAQAGRVAAGLPKGAAAMTWARKPAPQDAMIQA